VPDALQRLFVVAAAARGIADHGGIEPAVPGERHAELRELGSAVAGVAAQVTDGDAKAAVPFDRAAEARAVGLHGGAQVTGIEDQGLDVRPQVNRAVHVGLDVVVERVGVVGGRHRDERRDATRHAELPRQPEAVRIAERNPLHGSRRKPQVRGAEPRRPADKPSAEVERTVLRPAGRGRVIVGTAEYPALPQPAVAAGKRGEPAVTGSGLELRPVDAVVRHPPQDGQPAGQPVRVKVQRHPPLRIRRPALRER
jgi:hypothetical protein